MHGKEPTRTEGLNQNEQNNRLRRPWKGAFGPRMFSPNGLSATPSVENLTLGAQNLIMVADQDTWERLSDVK